MKPERDRRRSAWVGCLLLAALVLGGVVWASSASAPTSLGRPAAAGVNGGGGGTDNCVEPSSNNGNCAGTFTVTVGSVGGLTPTRTVAVPVTWSNPNNFDILVDGYTVSIPSTSRSTCPGSSVQVAGKVTLTGASRVTVPGRKSASTTLAVTMAAAAPEACQGVRYVVSVTATAVKK